MEDLALIPDFVLDRLREGSYALPDGRAVYYEDAQTLTDALDLYTVLDEDHDTGSPNIENEQAKAFAGQLQSGVGLSGVQVGRLRQLVKEHWAEIEALRARNRRGQNLVDVPDAASALIIERGDPV